MIYLHDRIKSVPIRELEEAIAKAVGEKTGLDVACFIDRVDFAKFDGVQVESITFTERLPSIGAQDSERGAPSGAPE